jgi:hypothetical protein
MGIIFKILLFVISFSSYCFSGTIDPSTPDSKYIEYGEKFTYVVKIYGTLNDDAKFYGSAVLIDDHHILTAAHVVKDSKDCNIKINNQDIEIKKIIIHPDFNDQFGVADIAIGYSNKTFDLKFYPELYKNNDEINKICSISGYGSTGSFNTGYYINDNIRRAGSNTIDRIDKDLLICSVSPKGSSRYTSLEFLIAGGDSGGPLFIDQKIAGINSCLFAKNVKPKSKYGEESGHTRVSKFVEWIENNKIKK